MASSPFTPPSFSTILQQILNDYISGTATYGYNNGLGLPADPGSEINLRAGAFSGQLAVLYQLGNVLVNSKIVDTAQGSDLDAVANEFGLQRRGATSAQGDVQLVSSVPQTLLFGSTLTGPNSLQYQVSQSGTYNPGANVPISAVDQGAQTNLAIGNIMNWTSPLPNMQSTCLVSIAVTGGANAEDDNTLRNRVYLALQSPAQMGNGQQVVVVAGSVDSLIQQPFIYNNFNGAGTQLVSLIGYQTTSYIGRDIPHLPYDGYVTTYGLSSLQPGLIVQAGGFGAYNKYSLENQGSNLSSDVSAIYGQMPGPVANPFATVITTVNNLPSDIAAVLTLPYPYGAPSNGFGGGWQDFTPWPNPDGYYVDKACTVVSVQGVGTVIGTQTGFGITINAPSSGIVHTNGNGSTISAQTYNTNTPTAGATHLQWINRSDSQDTGWVPVTATVLGATDNGNDTWSVVLDTPLVFQTDGYDFYGNTGVVAGDYIFPAAFNTQNYVNGMMTNYALLGPGQATSSQGLLSLGAARYPSSNAQFPTTMGVQVEKYLETNNNEVYAASINPQDAYNTAYVTPPVNAPVNVWIPRQMGFYPIEFYNFGKT